MAKKGTLMLVGIAVGVGIGAAIGNPGSGFIAGIVIGAGLAHQATGSDEEGAA